MKHRIELTALLLTALASTASAVTITVDMNGFPNTSGGHVGGPGLEQPIKFEPKAQTVKIDGLQAGQTYSFDFYHNGGEYSSDFLFTINEAGTGIASVSKAGGEAASFEVVEGFKPGDTALKIRTHEITYNGNAAQTGVYWVSGAIEQQPQGSKPVTVKVPPGVYSVDNLYNTAGGLEDFRFIVDNDGKVKAGPAIPPRPAEGDTPAFAGLPGGEEYAEYTGSTVNPRAALVRFKIEGSQPVNYHATHVPGAAAVQGNTYEFDVALPVGGAGLNVWSFGKNAVTQSDALHADGKPYKGRESENDFLFYPRLRYDEKNGYYFEGVDGPAKAVTAEASGMGDDGVTPLTVKITATVVRPYDSPAEAETRPAGDVMK